MSQILFERKASTLDDIDRAFVKTALAATLGVVVIYQLIKSNGIELVGWNLMFFLLSIPATYIFVFLIAESQKHALRFFLDGEGLVMEYEKADGDLIYLTNVVVKYWWTYRSVKNPGQVDLYMLVTGESGETIVLKDALMLPWESSPKDWTYSHIPVDSELFRLEISNLQDLVDALPKRYQS